MSSGTCRSRFVQTASTSSATVSLAARMPQGFGSAAIHSRSACVRLPSGRIRSKLEKGSPLSFTAALNALQRSCDQVVAMW